MLQGIINFGVRESQGFRERRIIQISNLISVIVGVLLLPMAALNYSVDEKLNALILALFSCVYFFNLYWNKIGNYLIPKLVLSYLMTINPFIHILITGEVPEGQYLSFVVVPIILVSVSGILFSGKRDKPLFYLTLAYFVVWMFSIDLIIYSLSNPKPNLQYIFDNYYFYKVPPIAALLILATMISVFNNIINKYEEENENTKKLLSDQNERLESMNVELEKRVAERTQKLAETYDKVVKLAFITSHEIRGPLATILGLTKLFKTKQSTEDTHEYLEKLHDKSEEMDKVISKMNRELESMPNPEELN